MLQYKTSGPLSLRTLITTLTCIRVPFVGTVRGLLRLRSSVNVVRPSSPNGVIIIKYTAVFYAGYLCCWQQKGQQSCRSLANCHPVEKLAECRTFLFYMNGEVFIITRKMGVDKFPTYLLYFQIINEQHLRNVL